MPAHKKPVQRVFSELKWEVSKIVFVNEFINAALLFFILNLVLAFFNIDWWISLIPAVIILIIRMVTAWKTTTIRSIERGNPEVNELLRTAYDNKSHNSLMMQALSAELQRKMQTVSAAVIIPPMRLVIKFAIVLVLAITPVFVIGLAPVLVQDNPLAGIDFSGININIPGLQLSDDLVELNQSGDIYGETDVIALGDDALDISLTTGAGGADFGNEQEVQNRDFRSQGRNPNVDIPQNTSAAIGVGIYEEEERKLISTYNCKTTGVCPDVD